MGCCQVQNQNESNVGKYIYNDDFSDNQNEDESSKNIISFEADHNDNLNLGKILRKIKNLKSIDIVFLIDCTASMNPYLKTIKSFLKQIISDADTFIRKRNISDDALNIGCVTYSDHSKVEKKEPVSKLYPFNCSFYANYYIDELKFEGGEDDHEAVIDGLYDAMYKLDWNDKSEKFILHLCDAPPHGVQYSTENLKDDYLSGCPCGKNDEEVLNKIADMKVRYIVVKLNNSIDKMI